MPRLSTYRSKRKFSETAEPKPKLSRKKQDRGRFCVQRHKARKLHYDFRLEIDGVLVSFAIPKGPTMDPTERRLAIRVEDHPLEYLTFEGVIPHGNYGAGIVEIWDRGIYNESQADLRKGLSAGHLRFTLHGKKLKGEFSLIKMKGADDNAWLFLKTAEHHASASQREKIQKMPDWIDPMLATAVDKAFDSDEWLFEIKWDGFRALAFLNGAKVQLWSRNHKSLNKTFPLLVKDLQQLGARAIIDGEIVVLDDKGVSHFELLQECSANPQCVPHYMMFDLLYVDRHDVRANPLIERKRLLRELLASNDAEFLHISDYVEAKGLALFEEVKKLGLEGLMGKRKESAYVSMRSHDWVKIKTTRRQEFAVLGFTRAPESKQPFKALILGLSSQGAFHYVGHVGGGFNSKNIATIYQKMKPLIQSACPFDQEPKTNNPATWLKPQLIAEVSFAEMTKAGRLRQPVFQGLRPDKSPRDVHDETPQSVNFNLPSLTNLDKVFWPKEGYTKGDMLAYYEAISPHILAHLKDRPLTLHRYPDGILGADFFQKNIDHPPSWLHTEIVAHAHGKGEERQALANDISSLLYIANLGSIEMHASLAHAGHLSYPDFLAIDLDPEAVPFKEVVRVALVTHGLLDELEIPHYCKTSGGRGLHIYIPLGGKFLYAQSLRFAELLAYLIQARLPSLISLERSPQRRQKRVYIDYLQNAAGKTMIAPYSLRALPNAPVSTPLKWSEVNDKLDPLQFNIASVPRRLGKLGDIFLPVLSGGIDLKDVLARLARHHS